MEKSTIILDMDNTLLENIEYSPDEEKKYPECLKIFSRNEKSNYYIIVPREGVSEFLSILPSRFSQIIIWSAGTRHYVEETCYRLFSSVGYIPTAILTRPDCVKDDKHYTKPLKKIMEDFDADPEKTFLLDDSSFLEKGNEKWKKNCFQVPRFFAQNGKDDVLPKLTKWIQNLPVESSYLSLPRPTFESDLFSK